MILRKPVIAILWMLTAFSLATCVLPAPGYASAQSNVITDQTSTPIPGAGHDYIQMLAETVNPANGSLSLHINLPTAPGRELSLPFGLSYGTGSACVPGPVGNWSPCGGGGWNTTVPYMTYHGTVYDISDGVERGIRGDVCPADR